MGTEWPILQHCRLCLSKLSFPNFYLKLHSFLVICIGSEGAIDQPVTLLNSQPRVAHESPQVLTGNVQNLDGV